MNILIVGGAASGKSAVAENIAVELSEKYGKQLYYVATLSKNSGGDTKERIARHRQMRANKNFITLEREKDFEHLSIPNGGIVLLEDLGNLTANEIFSGTVSAVAVDRHDTNTNYASNGKGSLRAPEAAALSASGAVFADGIARKIFNSLNHIAEQCEHFIVVSNNIFDGGVNYCNKDNEIESYDATTLLFMQALASSNNSWAENCERVIEVVAGIQVNIK